MNDELFGEFVKELHECITDEEWRHPDPIMHCLIEAASYGLLGYVVARSKQPTKPTIGHEAFTPINDETQTPR